VINKSLYSKIMRVRKDKVSLQNIEIFLRQMEIIKDSWIIEFDSSHTIRILNHEYLGEKLVKEETLYTVSKVHLSYMFDGWVLDLTLDQENKSGTCINYENISCSDEYILEIIEEHQNKFKFTV